MGHVTCRGCRHTKDARSTAVLAALLLLSSLFNISLVVLMVTNRSDDVLREEAYTPVDLEDGDLCVPCESGVGGDGGHHGDTSADVDIVTVDGGQMCCMKHAESWIHLVKLVQYLDESGVSELNSNATQEQKDVRPSAHVFLNQKEFRGDAMTWSVAPGFNTAHVTGNMKLVNNSLNIQEDGLYYVYTSVIFIVRETSYSSDITPNHVTHFMSRKNTQNSDRSGVLLSRLALLPNTRGKFASSCLEENIKLRSGDMLTVHISNYSFLYNYSVSNYFGIYRL